MGILDFTPKNNSNSGLANAKDQLMTLTDVIAPSAISITPRSINISGVVARVYYAVSYPRYLNDGWMEPVFSPGNNSQQTLLTGDGGCRSNRACKAHVVCWMAIAYKLRNKRSDAEYIRVHLTKRPSTSMRRCAVPSSLWIFSTRGRYLALTALSFLCCSHTALGGQNHGDLP